MFVLCLLSDQSLSSWLFVWFLIFGLVQVLFLILVINFKFFDSHFPFANLGLYLSLGTCRNKFTAWMVPSN